MEIIAVFKRFSKCFCFIGLRTMLKWLCVNMVLCQQRLQFSVDNFVSVSCCVCFLFMYLFLHCDILYNFV